MNNLRTSAAKILSVDRYRRMRMEQNRAGRGLHWTVRMLQDLRIAQGFRDGAIERRGIKVIFIHICRTGRFEIIRQLIPT